MQKRMCVTGLVLKLVTCFFSISQRYKYEWIPENVRKKTKQSGVFSRILATAIVIVSFCAASRRPIASGRFVMYSFKGFGGAFG